MAWPRMYLLRRVYMSQVRSKAGSWVAYPSGGSQFSRILVSEIAYRPGAQKGKDIDFNFSCFI